MGFFVVFLIGFIIFGTDTKDEYSWRSPMNVMVGIFFILFIIALCGGHYHNFR